MEDLKISKDSFIDQEPDAVVKFRVMNHIADSTLIPRKSLTKRYRHRLKVSALPVFALCFVFGGYILYQGSHTTTLQTEITKTKNAINDYVALDDNEIF